MVAVVVAGGEQVDSELVETAARMAAKRTDGILVIGMVIVTPWVERWAPLSGVTSLERMRSDALSTLEREVRRCVGLVPDTIAACHASHPDWTDSALTRVLERSGASAIVASADQLTARHRRRVRRVAKTLGAEVLMLGVQPAPSSKGLAPPRRQASASPSACLR